MWAVKDIHGRTVLHTMAGAGIEFKILIFQPCFVILNAIFAYEQGHTGAAARACLRHKYIQSSISLRKSWNKMNKTHIFEIMNGNFIVGANPRLERHVRNEFAESSDCLMAYNKIYEARVRMGKRLGTGEEDQDIMDIVDGVESKIQYICLKMYDYGAGTLTIAGGDKEFQLMGMIDKEWKDADHHVGKHIGHAMTRLKDRMGTDGSDPDIRILAGGYEYIARRMGLKMYGYGAYFTGRAKTAPDVPDFYGNAEIIEKDRFN